MLLYELAVNALHRFASCQAEHQVWVGAQIMGNDPGDQGCRSFVVFLYNYFHRGEIRLSPASLEGKKDRREVIHAPIWLTRLVGHGIKAWSAGLRPGESAKLKRAGSETGAPIDQNMMPRTKREHLRQLVEGKNQWSRPLTEEEKALGFLGWHERGYLPHCDFPGLIQFVTFRLADSMPSSRRAEWEHLLAIDDVREKRTKLESYLDRGHGCCNLRESGTAQLVEQTLLYFHEKRCEVVAWCVMPNHVHVLVHIWQTPLWKLVRSWKRHVAITDGPKALERRSPTRREPVDWLGRRPALQWQREYWDTFMRDEDQERTAVRYIENNPSKARLCTRALDWQYSSARFRDEYRRLVLPPEPNRPQPLDHTPPM